MRTALYTYGYQSAMVEGGRGGGAHTHTHSCTLVILIYNLLANRLNKPAIKLFSVEGKDAAICNLTLIMFG